MNKSRLTSSIAVRYGPSRCPDVTPGPHKLEAELVQNDTKPFDPPVKQAITFTAE